MVSEPFLSCFPKIGWRYFALFCVERTFSGGLGRYFALFLNFQEIVAKTTFGPIMSPGEDHVLVEINAYSSQVQTIDSVRGELASFFLFHFYMFTLTSENTYFCSYQRVLGSITP